MSSLEIDKLFYIPYNGDVSLNRTRTLRKGGYSYGLWVVTWLDEEHRVTRAGTVSSRLSQVDLLRGIYRAGYSVLEMSVEDIRAQGKRHYGGGIRLKRAALSFHE